MNNAKGILRALTIEIRHILEGYYKPDQEWEPGDLERRLKELGFLSGRESVPLSKLEHLSEADQRARRVIDGFLENCEEAGRGRDEALREFVRNSAYSWANRLLALRCMEARGLIDEVILQKEVYGGRSLQHKRLASKQPERCAGEDGGLFAMLFDEFEARSKELPLLFAPDAPAVALRPSVAALEQCIKLLSGITAPKGQEAATDDLFQAPDALGWAYQFWNSEEKERVFAKVRTEKQKKIEGNDVIPATCIYTEPYIVKFLVHNSLGAYWLAMHRESGLARSLEYLVEGAARGPVKKKPVSEITFLDPACGSGHFLLEAFDLFYEMYKEEGILSDPKEICKSIFEKNLFGIDIDERAIQIAALSLYMKAKEKAEDFVPTRMNLVSTNIRLPAGTNHLEAFLKRHREDEPLRPTLEAIFEALEHADELGALLQIEEPVERALRYLRLKGPDLFGPQDEEWETWKERLIERLCEHFDREAREGDITTSFFGQAASKGLSLVDILTRRYDIVATNPPYMGSKNMGPVLKRYVESHLPAGKRDLYGAFILRCLQLAKDGGRVAMVTQQSWMFLRSFADLRAIEDGSRNETFRGILRDTTIEVLAHLGPHAFSEIGGEVVNTVAFVLAKSPPPPNHWLTAFRLVGPKEPDTKDSLLRQAIQGLREQGPCQGAFGQ